VIPASRDLWVGSNARNVDKQDFETVLERPEPVSTPDVQRQFALWYRQINQGIAPVISRLILARSAMY